MASPANSRTAPVVRLCDLGAAHDFALVAAGIARSDAVADACLDVADQVWERMKQSEITNHADAVRKLAMIERGWRLGHAFEIDGPLLIEQIRHWMLTKARE